MDDSEISHFIGHNDITTGFTDEKEWAEKIKNLDYFNIVDIPSNEIIGTCSIRRIRNTDSFSLGIVIGEPDYREKGIGTATVYLMIWYAFRECNAHRVELRANADNSRAIQCYKKCGFKEFGYAHEVGYHAGKYFDMIYMEILRENWNDCVEI